MAKKKLCMTKPCKAARKRYRAAKKAGGKAKSSRKTSRKAITKKRYCGC